MGKRGLLDQIHKLQKEVKDLQYELLTVNERREIQERKYEDRKMKTKVKLMRARWGRVTRINGSSVGVDDAVMAIFQLYDNCESYI